MFDILGMIREPFLSSVNKNEAFSFESYREGMKRLEWVRQIQGMGVVVGRSGCGKSTMLRHYIEDLSPEHTKTISVHTTTGSPRDILNHIAWRLGVEPSAVRSKTVRLITQACHRLIERHIQPMLIVDEAHHLPNQSLHELRLLMNDHLDKVKLFILIFSANEEWESRLNLNYLEPLKGRITTWIRFNPLSAEEIPDYVKHRLALAGVSHNLFSPAAVSALTQSSHGVLRTLNSLAHHALLACVQTKETTVTVEHVRLACEEIGL